jgi:polyisoprenoid-binding protein YceI
MTLSGETNLSSWDESVTDFKGSLLADLNDDPFQIKAIEIQIPVEAIEAPRKGMLKDTREALKQEEHPEIAFASKTIKINGNTAFITGMLTIAGVSKEVTIKAVINAAGDKISLSGKHELSMLDYKVKPPKAMFGTLQVQQEVFITFSLVFLSE